MKRLTIAGLLSAQLATAQPAFAAELAEARTQQTGGFAGFRMRVPLDGAADERRLRAGLTLAPTLHSRTAAGESQLRFGEGIELGIAGRQPLRLTLAGQDLGRLGAQEGEQDEDRGGPSTLGWIAIGVGTLAVIVVGAAALCLADDDCIPSE
jgi:hypothetical protein